MRTLNRNLEGTNNSLRLTGKERQNAYIVGRFLLLLPLQVIRDLLWDWLVAAMSTESDQYNTSSARNNLIFVYEKLELLLEATYKYQ